ncbi:B-cell receptor CD22-like [Misgurnus anguillicaudatus]|uniref:B-cell receptor CD22-like n=1 Tax=Misgurnus anguillicaudatus TaxID=75329 RepID=UPI003CCF0647
MSIMLAPPPLIFLLMIHGVYSAKDKWGVNYSSSSICALKGSTVMINCTYEYPTGHQIMKVFWTNINRENPPDLFNNSKYSQRIQYLGDKHHDCTMRLTDVRQTDIHKYYFRFITDKEKYIGLPGVSLNITDLQVESSGDKVIEGHSVTLTCKSRCSLTNRSTFIWFKNTQLLSQRSDRNNQLILQSVTREDSGNYSCAVQGHNLTSPHQYLNVIYPPEETRVVVNPSGEIMEGDSVNLTCSSESNPPVHNYSWFKVNETSSVGSGQTYSITNINSRHSGLFYCEAQNEVGSQRSDAVSVNVKGGKDSVLYVVAGVSVGCGVFILILFIVFVWKCKHRPDDIRQSQDNMYSSGVSAPEFRHAEEILYSNVQHIKDIKTENDEMLLERPEPTTALRSTPDCSVLHATDVPTPGLTLPTATDALTPTTSVPTATDALTPTPSVPTATDALTHTPSVPTAVLIPEPSAEALPKGRAKEECFQGKNN